MLKNKFLLPIIALVLMLGAFIYFYIDLKDIKNTYKQDVQVSIAAKQEAEIAVLFTDLKKDFQISHLTTLKQSFEWKTEDSVLNVFGWGFSGPIGTDITLELTNYLSTLGFKDNALNSVKLENTNIYAYTKGELVCLFTSNTPDTRISIYCGFIK